MWVSCRASADPGRGSKAHPDTAETFSATIRKELALYGGVVKMAGIKMN